MKILIITLHYKADVLKYKPKAEHFSDKNHNFRVALLVLHKKGDSTLDISYENRVDRLHIWRRDSLQWFPHFHDSIEITCMLSGNVDMMIGGENYLLGAGDVSIAMPNVLHSYYRENDVDAYLLIVPRYYCGAFARLLKTHTVRQPVIRADVHDGKLNARIEELIRIWRSKSPFYQEILSGCFTMLFGEIFSYTGMAESRQVPEETERRLIAYCMEHYEQDISLAVLADTLHVSRSYISYIFSNKLHVSLPDFIGSLRMAEAKRQIKRGVGITEAAFNAGFSSVRTFNRRFYKESGMTPREFKKQLSEKDGQSGDS